MPPGTAGGSFLDEPEGTVPFGPSAQTQRRALDDAARALVQAHVDVLVELRTSSRTLRDQLVLAERELHEKVEREEPLTRSSMGRIRDLAAGYLELDSLLYALWTSYRAHLPHSSEPDPYAPMRAATLLSPSTRELGGLLSLAAELVRLDNANAVVSVLGPRHALTRFLNRGDAVLQLPAEGFDRCVGALLDPDHRALVQRQLRATAGERERLMTVSDARLLFLLDTIDTSKVARIIVDETDDKRRLRFLWNVLTRSSLNAVGPVLDAVIASGYIDESVP